MTSSNGTKHVAKQSQNGSLSYSKREKILSSKIYVMRCINGTPDTKLKEKSIAEPNPTLDIFKQIARTYEASSL